MVFFVLEMYVFCLLSWCIFFGMLNWQVVFLFYKFNELSFKCYIYNFVMIKYENE